MNSKIFFKPHVGNNHQNRLVLLSTISCPHATDCNKDYEKCTNGMSYMYDTECKFRNCNTYKGSTPIPLSESFLYQLEAYFKDDYEGYDLKKDKTYSKLTKAIAESMGYKLPVTENEKRRVWDNFICAELCQHFTKKVMTTITDFIDDDFEAFLELIKYYNITKIVLCEKPSFLFIKKAIDTRQHTYIENISSDEYIYDLKIDDRKVKLYRVHHPSYLNFYDGGRLIPVLKNFISE